jgi:hypothetical protein
MHRIRVAAVGAALSLGLFAAQPASAGSLLAANLTLVLGTLPPAVFSASGLTGMRAANGTLGGATWTVGAGAVPGVA